MKFLNDHANKILSTIKATRLSESLRNQGKTVILAGGCFDILHVGHITFLQEAKKRGEYLFVLLESDASIRKMKGPNRPINTQEDRAKVLSALTTVDIIIPLPGVLKNEDYDELILALKPAIIATNKADPNRLHKVRQATKSGSVLVDVGEEVQNLSTTHIAKLLQKDL
ncbi:MAG: adenylyltransferase/cytidyltransferase family protein [bacterium]|nr:adenylyltransferase/cytidyltransferase family protein [bacterium]